MGLFDSTFNGVKNNSNVTSQRFKIIEQGLQNNSNKCTNNLDTICSWYFTKYEKIYNRKALDNIFSVRSAIKKISGHYKISNWEVCKLINKWFIDFHKRGFDTNTWYKELNSKALNTAWIVDKLYNNLGPKENSIVYDYQVHSASRRIANGEKRPIKEELSGNVY